MHVEMSTNRHDQSIFQSADEEVDEVSEVYSKVCEKNSK